MLEPKYLENLDCIKKSWGKLPEVAAAVCTDTRKQKKGEGFICLVGPNFNAFDFIDKILAGDPSFVVFECNDSSEKIIDELAKKHKEVFFLGVSSTLDFLNQSASAKIRDWQNMGGKVIGVVGSNGKTTHKEMLAHLLEAVLPERVLATQGNLNNQIGLPLMAYKIEERHRIAILEMGTNHSGEIPILCEVAQPVAGIMTNIGVAHIEFFKTQENIFKEKSSLYYSVRKNTHDQGLFVIPSDDPFLEKLDDYPGLFRYGEKKANVPIYEVDQGYEIELDDQKFQLTNGNLTERFNLRNLACAFIFAAKMFPESINEILEQARNYKMPKMNRCEWVERGEMKIYLDAYNANPDSMSTSIKSFWKTIDVKGVDPSKVFYILGDMYELGDQSADFHRKIGELVHRLGVKNVAFVGKYGEFYQQGNQGGGTLYKSTEELAKSWKNLKKSYRWAFIKGSRSLQLEALLDI